MISFCVNSAQNDILLGLDAAALLLDELFFLNGKKINLLMTGIPYKNTLGAQSGGFIFFLLRKKSLSSLRAAAKLPRIFDFLLIEHSKLPNNLTDSKSPPNGALI